MRRPFGPGGARRGDFGGGIADRAGPDFRAGRRLGRDQSFGHDAPARSARCSHAARSAVKPRPRHRLAHPADRGDLGLERRPVVALGDRRPDRLDLVDMHRAGLGVGPIGMGQRRARARRARRRARETARPDRRSAPGSRPPRQSKKKRSIADRARFAARRAAPTASARSSSSPRARDAEPREQRVDQRRLEPRRPVAEHVGQRRRLGDQRQAAGELRQVPVDRLGLAAEGIEPGMVEIGGGEVLVPLGREAPRAIVEAFAGDR